MGAFYSSSYDRIAFVAYAIAHCAVREVGATETVTPASESPKLCGLVHVRARFPTSLCPSAPRPFLSSRPLGFLYGCAS